MAFTILNKRSNDLTDDEFLKLAEDFATNNGIFHGIYDEESRYRVDFYFYKTVTHDIESWIKLLCTSDSHTMSTLMPGKILASCYRLKKQK